MIESPPRRRSTWLNLLLGSALVGVICLTLVQAGKRANVRGDHGWPLQECQALPQLLHSWAGTPQWFAKVGMPGQDPDPHAQGIACGVRAQSL